MSKQVKDNSKFLWPSQKSWSLEQGTSREILQVFLLLSQDYPVPSCSLWLIFVFEQSPNYLSNVETREHRWVLGEKAERSWLLQGRSGQLTQPQRSNLSPMIYILRLWIIASRDGANKLQSQDELTIHNGVKFFMNGYVFLKFRYCEKATKFEKISHLILILFSNVNTKWEIFWNCCGLLKISKLY